MISHTRVEMATRALTKIFDGILASLPDMGNQRPCAEDIAAIVKDNLNRQPWPIRWFVIQAAVLLAGYSRRPKRFTSAASQMAPLAASLAVIADALFRRDGGNTRFLRSKA